MASVQRVRFNILPVRCRHSRRRHSRSPQRTSSLQSFSIQLPGKFFHILSAHSEIKLLTGLGGKLGWAANYSQSCCTKHLWHEREVGNRKVSLTCHLFYFPTDLFSSCSLTVPRQNRRPFSSRVPPPTEDTLLHLLGTAIEQQHRGQDTASLMVPRKHPSPPPRTPALPTRSPQTPLPCLQGIRGITAASSTLAASAAAS